MVTSIACTVHTDLPDSKHRLSRLDGHHRGCTNVASDPRHHPSGLHARHARQLDHLSVGLGLRPEVLARTGLDAVLQHHRFRRRDLCQYYHQEETTGGFEEKGEFIILFEVLNMMGRGRSITDLI